MFPDDFVTIQELKQRTVSGVGIVVLQGLLLRGVAFVGLLVLARQLTPRDFGAVAFGLTITTVARLFSDGGLGTALLRRPAPPTRLELQSLLGFQVAVSIPLAVTASVVGPWAGRPGLVCAIMVWTLPIGALKVPGSILLERHMKFAQRVRVEIVETFVYYAWAISAVGMGYGVLGLATGTLIGAVAGVAVMATVSPIGVPIPRFSIRTVKPLLRFGFQFQGVSAVSLLRDQGLNLTVMSIAGIGVLGLWNMAYRFLSIPFLLFEALWRVSIPATSMLMRSGSEVAERVQKVLSAASVATGMVLAPLAASAPAWIALLLGSRWQEVATVIAPACLGLLINGPASVAAAAYTYASGNAGLVLRAAIAHTLAWFAVSVPLLSLWGVGALGAGWLAASVVDAIYFSRPLRSLGIGLFRTVWPTYLAGVLAYLAGSAVLEALGRSWAGAFVSVFVASLTYLACELLIHRSAVREAQLLLRSALARAT